MSNNQSNQPEGFTLDDIVMGLFLRTGPAREEVEKFRHKCAEVAKSISGYFQGAFNIAKAAVADAFGNASQIEKLTNKLNGSCTKEVSIFVNMLGLAKLSTDDSLTVAEKGFASLADTIRKLDSDFLDLGNGHVVSLFNDNGKLKDELTFFNELQAVIQGIADESERAEAIKGLNLSEPFTKILEMDTGEYLNKLSQGAERGLVTEKVIENAKRLRSVMESIKQIWLDIGGAILNKIVPYMEKAAEIARTIDDFLKENHLLFILLSSAVIAFIGTIFIAIAPFLTTFLLIFAAVVSLGAVLYAVYTIVAKIVSLLARVGKWAWKKLFGKKDGSEENQIEAQFKDNTQTEIKTSDSSAFNLPDLAIPPMAPLQTPKEMENNYGPSISRNMADNSKTTNISQDNKIYVTVKDVRDVQTVKTIMNQQATGLV